MQGWLFASNLARQTCTWIPIQVFDKLEEQLIREAEMVFTTLSSTGRKIFTRLKGVFEAVLVDEAAQATELATLQALAFECKQYV